MKKYDEIRKQYPEYVSLDKVYQICGISKRSASYLVEQGIIPALDTGRKTWRYRVALEDIISYLSKREKVGSMIPRGAATSRRNYQTGCRESFASIIKSSDGHEVTEYFNYIYADFPDILQIPDLVDMTGLSKKTLSLFLKDGYIKCLTNHPHYLIPKTYLLEFVSTTKFIDCKSNSEVFKKILGGFKLWKTAK